MLEDAGEEGGEDGDDVEPHTLRSYKEPAIRWPGVGVGDSNAEVLHGDIDIEVEGLI